MRVVIADDATLWREGLARLLVEVGIEPCALVGDGEALVEAVEQHRPDVALIDVRMPPTFTYEGAEVAVELRSRWSRLGVILLSQTVEAGHAAALVRDNPRGFGYLLKDRVLDVTTLVDALRSVRDQGTVLDPEVVSGLLGSRKKRNRLDELSQREFEVLALIAQGRSNVALSRALGVSEKTVEHHIASIFTKLGLLQEPDHHRRVLAVLSYLDARSSLTGPA